MILLILATALAGAVLGAAAAMARNQIATTALTVLRELVGLLDHARPPIPLCAPHPGRHTGAYIRAHTEVTA